MIESVVHNQIQTGRWVEDLKLRQYAPPDVWEDGDHLRVRLKLRYERQIAFDSDPGVDVEFDLAWECTSGRLRADISNIDVDVDLSKLSFLFVNVSKLERDLGSGVRDIYVRLETALSPRQQFPVCPSISYSDLAGDTASFDYGAYDSSPTLMCRPLS